MQCVLTGQAGGRLGPRIQEGSVSGAPGRRGIPSRVRGACGSARGRPRWCHPRAWPSRPRRGPAGQAPPGPSSPRGQWARGRSRAPSVGKRKQRERDVRRGPAVSSRRQECEEEGWAGSGRREGRPRGLRQPRGGGAAARAPGVPAEGLQARAPASVSRFDMTGATFGKSHGTATHRGGDSGEASPQMRKLRHRVERLAQGHTAGR